MAQKRIAVVDDHREFLSFMCDFLGEQGYDVLTISRHQGAFERIKQHEPDVIVCDLVFSGETRGQALIERLQHAPETSTIPLVLCSAATQAMRESRHVLVSQGIRLLEKPFEPALLLDTLRECLATRVPETIPHVDK